MNLNVIDQTGKGGGRKTETSANKISTSANEISTSANKIYYGGI